MKRFYEVIKKPILTEKSTATGELYNKYAFEVDSTASKPLIKQAVEDLFDVKVLKVNTMVVPGKWKRFSQGLKKKSNWKKAVVQLAPGQKIEYFKGV